MKLFPVAAALLLLAACNSAENKDLKINDLEYFANRGVNVLVYSNTFSGGFNDEKDSGIEIIHHGVRTVQGGAIRLSNTPEQWDLVPATTSREVNLDDNSIEVGLRYDDFDFDSRVVVTGKGDAFEIAVYLDKPVPEELVGDAGFNLEFLPSQYWLKTYIIDGKPDRFPRYAVSNTVARPNSEKIKQYKGYKTYDDRGTDQFVDPLPLATGHEILMAPDDPERTIKVTSEGADLNLYDGRILAQNGWFVLRSLLPAGQTGKVLSWTIEPNSIDGWIREPNIGFSQVGYMPDQPKVAVIELDKNAKVLGKASICKVNDDGSTKT
ncbi:MAG: glycoside hydrolase, partial [Bacteroidales bacterium]|nr:glycoside hydrolase [Bacteroidales bacterium]